MTELTWPFLGQEVLAARALPERAMRALYTPAYPGVFAPGGIDLTASQRAEAAWLWSRRKATVSGRSAAALLGARWVDATADAELIYANRRPPAGITVHSETLLPDEVGEVGGIVVTSPARTPFDLGRRVGSRLGAVQQLDALANATEIKDVDIAAIMSRHPGVRGITRLRRVLPLVDGGAESPQETRARLALIDAGLPGPQTQLVVRDEYGEFVARLDMGYEDVRVGIEYDGPQHWTDAQQRDRDIDRYSALLDLGWVIVRVSSELLRYRQATFIARVVAAMHATRWRA